jgi:hypothetical protein
VLPTPVQYVPVQDTLDAAGDTGYLHRRETTDGSTPTYQWHGYDGTERTVENFTGKVPGQQGYYGAGTDVLPVPIDASGVVELRDPATGASTQLTVPDGQYTVGSFDGTVLTRHAHRDGRRLTTPVPDPIRNTGLRVGAGRVWDRLGPGQGLVRGPVRGPAQAPYDPHPWRCSCT